MAKDKRKLRLVTGIRPTAGLHLGNYLGAIKPAVELQQKYQTFLCIVDLHALTTPFKPRALRGLIESVAIDWLACGLEPELSTFFIQSHIPEHVELMWLLNTITPLGELQRMVQYKEFKEAYGEPQAGILNYPILMAADILIYKAQAVPVGEDQLQHLELTRLLAKKFNRLFGETFPLPENVVSRRQSVRLMSLNDPTKKMSKSLGPKSYIALADTPETIRRKIASAVTDTGPSMVVSDQEMSPGVKNLFLLLKNFGEGDTYEHLLNQYYEGSLRYAALKPIVADSIINYLMPIQKRRQKLASQPEKIAKILKEGAERARKVAQQTLKEVKEKIGLIA